MLPLESLASPRHRLDLPTIDDEKAVTIGVSDSPKSLINPAELRRGKEVGFGQYSRVYRGSWRGEHVAIKRVKVKTQKECDMIAREVEVLSRVNFENVVSFAGIASISTHVLEIVMELCQGGTVFDLCHNSDMDVAWLQQHKMISDVAHAVRYLHNLQPPIIHRDLKSLNLLLARPLREQADVPLVKVTDFGFSRFKEGTTKWGKMTGNVGTCHWMAPEVWSGKQYDDKADVYSFSIVVYEIVCLSVPFENLEPQEAVKSTAKGMRPALSEVPPDCPNELRELMIKCWAHSPLNRPSFERIVVEIEGPIARAIGAEPRLVSL